MEPHESTPGDGNNPKFTGEWNAGSRRLAEDLGECLKQYARENPGTAALWCLGIGFVLGWKLKPW